MTPTPPVPTTPPNPLPLPPPDADLLAYFAPWSISKADLARKCPKAFRFRYVDKVRTESGTEAKVGTAAHRVIELLLQGAGITEAEQQAIAEAKNLTSTEIEALYGHREASVAYADRIASYRTRYNIVFEAQELRLAVNDAGRAIGYDDPKAFFRGAIDHVLVHDRRAIVIDHKSGKVKPIDQHWKQLDSYAVLSHANMLEHNLRDVRAAIHHLRAQHLDWHVGRDKQTTTQTLFPWLRGYLQACARGLEGFEATPNRLCPWCDYEKRCEEGQAFIAANKLKRKSRKS